MKSAKYFPLLPLLWTMFANAQHVEQLRPNIPSAPDTTVLSGTLSPWVHNAEKLGPVDEQRHVAITVYLRWRNQRALERLIESQTTPGNPGFGQFLTPALFHAQFSPRVEDVRAVQNALQKVGFRIEFTPASRLFVRASGTVSQIKSAFQVSQNLYSYRGKTLRSHSEDPVIPTSLAELVSYIGGLDDSRLLIRPAHVGRDRFSETPLSGTSPALHPPYGYPVNFPCSNYWGDTVAQLDSPTPFPYGSNLPWIPCGYTPQQLQQAYGVNKVKQTGQGVRIAITDLYYSKTLEEDVNRFSENHGLPALTYLNFAQIIPPGVNVIPQGDPCSAIGWQVEQTLDVTAVHLMAPEAFILFVAGVCDAADEPDQGEAEEPLYEVIDNRLADIVTNSWAYNGEEDVAPGVVVSDTAKFMQAAAQGMTLLFAAGDNGDATPTGKDIASGSWPATNPYVTAVGGTSLLLKKASGEKSEFGWANYYSAFDNPVISNNGATVTDQGWTGFFYGGSSGGGPSLLMLQPSYQKGVVPKALATRTYTTSGTVVPLDPPRRVVPDISMAADPNTGLLFGETYLIYSPPVDPGCLQLSATTEYCEEEIGGTSVATPLLAGVMGLVNQARFSQNLGPVGFANPALYRLPVGTSAGSGTPIVDVNAPSKPTGGLYGALGYDNYAVFVAIDSYEDSSGKVIENVDTSLHSSPGYDNVTGLGAPSVPELIEALGQK
jgi:subtilase family serine protease